MKKIFIHGGSSQISKYLIRDLIKDYQEFYIFCRNINKAKLVLNINEFKENKFYFFENSLDNIDLTLSDIDKLPDDLDGIIWVSGFTGNPSIEINNLDKTRYNIEVNFSNVILSITSLLKKINYSKEAFICVICSVAGIRGRKKRLYYAASKAGLINFMSGLRQQLNNKSKVITIIPGYISTESFEKLNEKSPKFLISSPSKASKIIINAIKKNKEIVYLNSYWRIIMWIIKLIPEKIYKKLEF